MKWALAQATLREADVTAVQCWEILDGWPDDPNPAAQLAAARDRLRALKSSLGPAASTLEIEVLRGHAVTELLHRAEDAALLVLGTRGMGGFQRLLLGSTSLHAVTHSPIPVAVIPPAADLIGNLASVVVGVDGSDRSRAALEWAMQFARPATTVHAVGVWQPPLWDSGMDAEQVDVGSDAFRRGFEEAVDEVVAAFPDQMPEVRRVVRRAKPATVLLEYAATSGLLVVGDRGRGAIASAILGSVSNEVLHQAKCPTVVVPVGRV